MPIPIREDVVFTILKKIKDTDGQGIHEVNFDESDFFPGIQITKAELLGHFDYLNQKQYINAEFTGNAYANQEDVPSAVNPKEFDFRIANSFGSPDGPLPHFITFKAAELTEKGQKMLEKMEANPPKIEGPSVPIATKDMPFLEKVMIKGGFEDIFDARDVTEVIYRAMRDLMPEETVERVKDELHAEVLPTEDKALQMEIADLWKDTNPIVSFLSKIRPAFDHSNRHNPTDLSNVNDDRFLFRVKNEAPMAATGYDLDRDQVVKAVFSATKEELSEDRVKEIANYLPGKVRQLWEEA